MRPGLDDKPPRMEIRKLEDEASSLMQKLISVRYGTTAPLRSIRIASTVGEWFGLDDKREGALASSLTPLLVDRPFTKRLLWRLCLFIMSNIDAVRRGEDLGLIVSEARKHDRWTALVASDIKKAGFTVNGKRMSLVSFTEIWGPLAGVEFTTSYSDAYLCGIVRSISGCRWATNIAATDISLMRLRCVIGKGERDIRIKRLDENWSTGNARNSRIRKWREGCSRFPCEKCGMTRAECDYSPLPKDEEIK